MGNCTKVISVNNLAVVSIKLLMLIIFILSCRPSEPLSVTVLELSTCRDEDIEEKPLNISKRFLTTEDQILACGYLETNQPITLSVNWYNEDKKQRVFREIVRDVTDYFYSTYKPSGEEFLEGNYKIEVVIGKEAVRSANFKIEGP